MHSTLRAVAVLALAAAMLWQPTPATAQGRGGQPRQRVELAVPPLPDGPVEYATAEGLRIRLVVLARGLEYPWSIGFLPNGDKLVVERPGRLRIIRDDRLLPEPVRGVPEVRATSSAGLGDIAVHPDFARNGWIYLSYNKPLEGGGAELAIARGVFSDDALTDVHDIFVTDEAGGASRLIFGADGKLYASTFGGNGGDSQDPALLSGKVLRLNPDGSVPADNPFVGKAGFDPEIYTMGHRTPSGLTVHEPTGTIYEVEMGPNGGDEINVLVAGANYGWPLVSLGRDYSGRWQSEKFNRDGMQDPVVYWMPSISTSGLDFYTGNKLAAWKGDLFVGGVRFGEISGTGQLQRIRFNDQMQESRREALLTDLRQRIRDVRQGPDELLYLLTDADSGAVLRIEPAD
jgi:aldose sugar dehydrogenase